MNPHDELEIVVGSGGMAGKSANKIAKEPPPGLKFGYETEYSQGGTPGGGSG